ncbi:MAG TPA: sugar phosphate isomerase/epimerase [Planctomycetia bacterium]|nr:sugar phosphate isomerase/epimerase [Planctomycetia bacterium]
MRFVYFTKLLKGKSVAELADFLTSAGLGGADLCVRPGYPVTPASAKKELPSVVQLFRDRKLTIPLVSAPTDMIDPADPAAIALFEACGKARVPMVKIGYFRFSGRWNNTLDEARKKLAGFAKLGLRNGVRALYHTHSGSYVGSNCEGMRWLLSDLDPHDIGAFVDTGHQAVGGAPLRQAFEAVAPWLSMIAIKDFAWEKTPQGWKNRVVPAGEGIVNWKEFSQALADRHYTGAVSLHGEYETTDDADRLAKAKAEREFLQRLTTSK